MMNGTTDNITSNIVGSMQLETDICFQIVGKSNTVYVGQSKTLSATDLSFNTTQPLTSGMLLQMTMQAKESNSPSLQTMVEVVNVEPLENNTGFHISSNIKDIAIGV